MGAPQLEGWIMVNVDPVVFAKSHECVVGAGMTQWLLAGSTDEISLEAIAFRNTVLFASGL